MSNLNITTSDTFLSSMNKYNSLVNKVSDLIDKPVANAVNAQNAINSKNAETATNALNLNNKPASYYSSTDNVASSVNTLNTSLRQWVNDTFALKTTLDNMSANHSVELLPTGTTTLSYALNKPFHKALKIDAPITLNFDIPDDLNIPISVVMIESSNTAFVTLTDAKFLSNVNDPGKIQGAFKLIYYLSYSSLTKEWYVTNVGVDK